MAKHVGVKLPEDLVAVLKNGQTIAVLATFSEKGLPKSQWLNYKVMEHFTYNGEYWTNGTIHQIKKGTSYDAKIHMKSYNAIVVRGYVLVTLLGEDVNFSRYTGGLPKQE